MLQPATPQNCDIFFCYRKDSGCTLAKEIYQWMFHHQTLDFGYVYFSDVREMANYMNDIDVYIPIAKRIILVLTKEFTDKFPSTYEAYIAQSRTDADIITVTAFEVKAIMERMRNNPGDNPIICVRDNEAVEFNPTPLALLASNFNSAATEEPENKRLVRCFTTCTKNYIPRRGVKILYNDEDFEKIFKICSVSDLARQRAVAGLMGNIPQPSFDMLAQNVEVEFKDKSYRTSISALADDLIQKPFDLKGAYDYRIAVIRGTAGMGKTTQLQELCRTRNNARKQSLKNPPFFYLPAHNLDLNNYSMDGFYRAFMKQCGIDTNKYHDAEDYVLNNLLCDPFTVNVPTVSAGTLEPKSIPCPSCVVIDALDEVEDPRNERLIYSAIAKIAQKGIAVILSSRAITSLNSSEYPGLLTAKMCGLEHALEILPPDYRPREGTPLAELLKIPMYFTMYRMAVDGKDGNVTFAKLYQLDDSEYYHYKDPTTHGELLWNCVMRHLAKKRGAPGSRTQNELTHWFYLLYVLPRLAFFMVDNAKPELSHAELTNEYNAILKEFTLWVPFWNQNSTLKIKRAELDRSSIDSDNFLHFCTSTFPLLKIEDKKSLYKFTHDIWLRFFEAIDFANAICAIASSGYEMPNLSRSSLRKLCLTPLSAGTAKLVGEICGERFNIPVLETDTQKWHAPHQRKYHILHDALDCLRTNHEASGLLSTPILVSNIFHILKSARVQGDGIPDLSGVDLSGLDLTRCSLVNINFSHVNPYHPEDALCANFRGSRLDATVSFSGGHRNVLKNLSISAMHLWKPNRLLSIDETGCAVLWDTDYELPIFVRHLKNGNGKYVISNIVEDMEHKLWVACSNTLTCLTLEQSADLFSVQDFAQLQTRSVNQLEYDRKTNTLSYYPTVTPFDRYHLDGSPFGSIDGRWMPQVLVDGDEAFVVSYIGASHCPCGDDCPGRHDCEKTYSINPMYDGEAGSAEEERIIPMCVPEDYATAMCEAELRRMVEKKTKAEGKRKKQHSKKAFHKLDVNAVMEIEAWTRKNEEWVFDKTIISHKMLVDFTGCTSFAYAHMYLQKSKSMRILTIALSCTNNQGQRRGMILRIDTKNNTLLRKHVLPQGRAIHSMCCAKNSLFCASYLTIFRDNKLGDTQLFSSCEGRVLGAQFMPDTRSFFTFTDNPVRIHIFSCDQLPGWRCIAQITPTVEKRNLLHATIASLAFRYREGLEFSTSNCTDHMEHTSLVLCDAQKSAYTVYVCSGETTAGIPNEVCLINNPKISFFGENVGRLNQHNGTVRIISKTSPNRTLSLVEVHSEWLFAGCDFFDATFINGEIPPVLEHYIKNDYEAEATSADDMDFYEDDEDFFDAYEEDLF